MEAAWKAHNYCYVNITIMLLIISNHASDKFKPLEPSTTDIFTHNYVNIISTYVQIISNYVTTTRQLNTVSDHHCYKDNGKR